MKRSRLALVVAGLAISLPIAAQQGAQAPAPPAWVSVRPIEPPAAPLPDEAASAGVTRFSFIAYGDTRSGSVPDVPGDGQILHPEHSRLVERMIERINQAKSTAFPIR